MDYVKLENGRLVAGPFKLQDDRTASPNIRWSEEQMAIHGFALVDLTCADNEIVDYYHPVIVNGKVSFPRLPKPAKTQAELDAEAAALEAQNVELLIQKKIRDTAIADLKKDGLLDTKGKTTAAGKTAADSLKVKA